MTALSGDPGWDPERYLAGVFDELTAVGTAEASARIAVHAAAELADVDGLCLVSPDGDRCVVALAQQQEIYLCDLRNSSLYRASARQLLWDKEDVIQLPTGEHRRVGVALIECTLPYELGARTRLTFNPGGVLCELEIPLEACATSVEPAAQQTARGGSR